MPLNEYDELLSGAKPAEGNEYDSLLNNDADVGKTNLRQAMYASSTINPDRQADVLKLSDKMKVPSAFVERNYDTLKQREQIVGMDYDSMLQKNPKLSAWMTNPENAGISKDDIEGLRGIENSYKNYSLLHSAYRAVNSGAAHLFASAARVPALLNDVSLLPINLGYRYILGKTDKTFVTPDWFRNNPVATFFDEQAKLWATPEMSADVIDQIKEGKFSDAARSLFLQVAENAPTMVALIATAGAGAGAAGLAGAGALQAADVAKESAASGADPTAGTVNALLQGSIESAFEKIGTFGILKKWESQIAKSFGKDTSKRVFKDFAQTMFYSMAAEGNEEALTSAAQDFSDYITGVNPDALKGLGQRALNAGLVGAASGGLMTGPAGAVQGVSRLDQTRRTQLARDFYLSFGNSALATKLRERLPQKQKEYVEFIVKDSPVENLYIDPEDFESYFQDKNIPPETVLSELDLAKEFSEAKEHGTDVKIPLSKWVDKVVGTEHYAGLANDVKFSPESTSVNQEAALRDEAKLAEEEAAKVEAVEEGPQIRESIKQQLIEAGVHEKEAALQAQIHESFFETLASRSNTGESALELFKKRGLQITRDGKVLPIPGTSVFNQEAVDRPAFYSKLEQTLDQKIQGKSATKEQVEGIIRDIKPEERKWSGIDEFLKGKDKVSKQDMLDFIRGNQIQIKEVVLSGRQAEGVATNVDALTEELRQTEEFRRKEQRRIFDEIVQQDKEPFEAQGFLQAIIDNTEDQTVLDRFKEQFPTINIDDYIGFLNEEARLIKEIDTAERQFDGVEAEEPKFSDYTLPGGENYREVLFTLPPDNTENLSKRITEIEVQLEKEEVGEKRQELIAELRNLTRAKKGTDGSVFRSSHFDQPNILAHVRLNDRTDSEGNRVLFVEEIQSDWHQAGRKRGYQGDLDTTNLKANKGNGYYEIVNQNGQFITNVTENDVSPLTEETALKEARRRIEQEPRRTRIQEGVPDAPFRKTWHEFAFKKIIRQAVEQGYDKIAWTTGEQQNERYDLSKQVRSIDVIRTGENEYSIAALPINDRSIHEIATGIPFDKVEDYVGKDLSKKVKEDLTGPFKDVETKTYEGGDLKVGGQGMKGFYDQIIPKFVNKFTKKWGGKVEDIRIETGREPLQFDDFDRTEIDPDAESVTDAWLLIDPERFNAEYVDLEEFTNEDGSTEYQANISGNAHLVGKTFDEALDNISTLLGAKEFGIEAHSVEVTDKMKESVLKEGMTLFQDGDSEGPRGRIRIDPNKNFTIDLLKNADRSTFLHESGHFFLEITKDAVESGVANEQLQEDYQTIRDWVGLKEGEDFKTEHHEQFARGFERYLMEGKAPSARLRRAFAAFRAWLTHIYRSIQGLNVELTPEVRDVFARMLATEEEINAAEIETQTGFLFSDPAAQGMNEQKATKYRQAREDARIAAEDYLSAQLMEEVRKEETKAYREDRKQIKAEVEAEANQQPVYRATSILQKGVMPDGTELPAGVYPFKLSKEAIAQDYGKDYLDGLPKGIFDKETGVHPDIAASMLGFETGDDLLNNLANAPKKSDYIRQETERRLAEKYPTKLSNQESLHAEALKALHNDKRAKFLRLELEHLASNDLPVLKDVIRRVARRVPTNQAIRSQAESIIQDKKVSDAKPYLYLRAEVKASKQAGEALARGDIDAAFVAKQRELLNHELYRAAVSAQEDVEKATNRFKKAFRSDERLSKTRDLDFVNAVRSLLALHGLGQSDKVPLDYLASLKQYSPESYQTILHLIEPLARDGTNYKDMTVGQFAELTTAIDALWELSRSEKQIEIDGQKVDRDVVIEALNRRMDSLQSEDKSRYEKSATTWDNVKMGLLGARAALSRVEHWAQAMDGKDPQGVFRKYIWNPISDAVNNYRVEKETYIKKYLSLLEAVRPGMTHQDVIAEELINSKTGKVKVFQGKAEILGALLHTGNQSNFEKLLRGYGWGDLNSDGTLDVSRWNAFIERMAKEGVLTKADMDFVQNVWDLFEELKPRAQQAHKKMYGFYFSEITAAPVQTPWGIYRGGYAPAIADPFQAPDADIRNEREALEKNDNSFMFPTTGRGFTKARVRQYAAPLQLNLRFVGGHIDKVLRFANIEPHVKDVGKLIWNRDLRAALDSFDPAIVGDMIVPWLQRSAQQKVTTPSKGKGWQFIDSVSRHIRTNTGYQIMVGNVVNTLQQFTGLSIAAVKVPPKYLRNALWNYIRSPKSMAQNIQEKSDFMKTRTATQVFEIENNIDNIIVNPTKYDKAREFARQHGYILQQFTQNIVDNMTWGGAYEQAVEQGLSEKEAVRAADSAVRLTQGSFNAEDISRFETGSPTMRMFTQFYSYFNMQANLLGTEFAISIREMGLKKSASRLLYVYAMGFMIPAVLSELIVQAMGGSFDEDDDDQYLDDFMNYWLMGQVRTATALFPFIGPAVMAGINAFNDKWYDDRISTSPAISSLESAVKAPHSVGSALFGEGSKKKAIRDALTAIGLLTGVPVAPLSRPLGYLSDISEDKAQPQGPVDFVRGLITGRAGKP